MLTPNETQFIFALARQALATDASRYSQRAWAPRLAEPHVVSDADVADVLDDLLEWFVDDRSPCYCRSSTPEQREALERLVCRLLGDAGDQSERICVGCRIWSMILLAEDQHHRAPQFAWRVVRTVTKAVHGRQEALEDLAVCWYESLCYKPEYLPALLDEPLPLTALIDIATHTGYMSREERLTLHRTPQAALPHEDIWAFRQAVTARGYPPWDQVRQA